MLTSVEITNPRGSTLRLPLQDTSGGYSVREIDGLDPVDAVLTSSSLAQVDGAAPQNARRDIRNITMKLGLQPNFYEQTVQTLRSNLYSYLMPKSTVMMGFYIDGDLSYTASGQVETFANALFSADPEVDVSIVCYDPDFYAPTAEVLSTNTTSSSSVNTIDYEGTSDAGIIFALNVNRSLSELVLTNTTPSLDVQKFSVSGSYVSGDVITINSIPGQKSVTLKRAGITTPVLYDVEQPSDWINLERGNNVLRVFATGAAIPCTVMYVPKFGGI